MNNEYTDVKSHNPCGLLKTILVGIFVFISCLAVKAHITADSLKLVLSKPDLPQGERIMAMGKLAHIVYYRKNPEEARTLLEDALKRADIHGEPQHKAYLYSLLASQYSESENPVLAQQCLDSALHYDALTDDKAIKGYVQYNKGWMEIRQNEPQGAIASFLEGARLLEGTEAYAYESSIYGELSGLFGQWNDLLNQEKYARMALSSAMRSNNADVLVAAYHTMANSFMNGYRNDSTQRFGIDSALSYYKRAIPVMQRYRDRLVHLTELAATAYRIAEVYSDYIPATPRDTVSHYLDMAMDEAKRTNAHITLANCYIRLGDDAIAEADYQHAELCLANAVFTLYQEPIIDNKTALKISKSFSVMREKQGNLGEALHYYKEYVDAYTNLFDIEKMNLSKQLEAQYEASKKERELAVLQEKVAYNRKLSQVYVALVAAFLLAALFLVYAYKNRVKAMKQQEQLHQMEIDKMKQEHRISLLSAMLEGQEEERSRLAKDLHDGLGGLLSGIKMELSGIMVMLKDSLHRQLIEKTMKGLDDAVNELRHIAHSMMPEILMRFGLAEAIREYCQKLNTPAINIESQVFHYVDEMPHSRQVVLYRIMQELVNNAIKHAQASKILIQLQQVDRMIFLTVEDDGNGLDMDRLNEKKGAGLINVQARVEFLNGSIDIHAEKGIGTSITIECADQADLG
ncbi:sensor histidine kinase [Parapedobacter tibetensis]|uniref:sensor histidine kinase n=1 Tax=Parapedobacter tibetensis TaxID=2972951 RepID=UPI00214DA3BD|nr:sensor histidine kinase [Parapedobacter tibetensis]